MAMPIVSYKISLKGLIYYSTTYYSETLGRFKYDVSELFYFTSKYAMGYKILCMEHNCKKYYFILVRLSKMLQF